MTIDPNRLNQIEEMTNHLLTQEQQDAGLTIEDGVWLTKDGPLQCIFGYLPWLDSTYEQLLEEAFDCYRTGRKSAACTLFVAIIEGVVSHLLDHYSLATIEDGNVLSQRTDRNGNPIRLNSARAKLQELKQYGNLTSEKTDIITKFIDEIPQYNRIRHGIFCPDDPKLVRQTVGQLYLIMLVALPDNMVNYDGWQLSSRFWEAMGSP